MHVQARAYTHTHTPVTNDNYSLTPFSQERVKEKHYSRGIRKRIDTAKWSRQTCLHWALASSSLATASTDRLLLSASLPLRLQQWGKAIRSRGVSMCCLQRKCRLTGCWVQIIPSWDQKKKLENVLISIEGIDQVLRFCSKRLITCLVHAIFSRILNVLYIISVSGSHSLKF